MGNQYWLEGTVNVPKDRKAELNDSILMLLERCGIRKLREITVDGKMVTVARRPKADSRGIVEFDYSVFEEQRREGFYYDKNVCALCVGDCGYAEFGLAMNLVMTLLEAYSAERCYLMKENQVCDIGVYAALVEEILGVKLTFPNREKIWDMLVYFKSCDRDRNVAHEEFWNWFPYGHGKVDMEQLMACVVSERASAPKDCSRLKKSEISQVKACQRAYHVYEIVQDFMKAGESKAVEDFLKELLETDFAGRERLAQREDVFGEIAEVSLYEMPAYLVAAYGWAAQREFWEVWFSLGITGYTDIYRNDDDKDESEEEAPRKRKRWFYRALGRDSEDEFLEYMENRELYFSDDMKTNLAEWKRRYEAVHEVEARDICMEPYLAEILLELRDIWNRRYADEEFVTDFLEHCKDVRHQKALLVLRDMMDEILKYFPELTVRQAKEWVIKGCYAAVGGAKLCGYVSLLTNKARRAALLGF